MVRLTDYLAIESGLAQYLGGLVDKKLRPLMPKISHAASQGDAARAVQLIDDLDVQLIAQEAEPSIKMSMTMAMLFGGMMLSGKKTKIEAQGLPDLAEPVQAFYANSLDSMKASIRTQLSATLSREDTQKADNDHDSCDGHHHSSNPVIDLLKADKLSLADRLNAVVMGQAKGLMDIAANLSTTRLVSLGFLTEASKSGIDVYQMTAVLDGHACPVCRTMHGKVFEVESARVATLNVLRETDPAMIKAKAPFPSQSRASVKAMRAMTPYELQGNGYALNPYHPGCRCLPVKVGTVPDSQVLPVGTPKTPLLPDVALPEPVQLAALNDKTLTPMAAASDKLKSKLSSGQMTALDKIANDDLVNKWLRVCTAPQLIQKAESDFSFCSAFNPKQMGKLVSEGNYGVKAWELDAELKAWRIATGDFAQELLQNMGQLKGSVINDKGFALWKDSFVPKDGTPWVKVHITAPKGAKAVKIGDQYAFPSDTKFQVYDTKIGKDGVHTVYVKPIEELATKAPLVNSPSGKPWWADHLSDDDWEYYNEIKFTEADLFDSNEANKWQAAADKGLKYEIKPYPGSDALKSPAPKATETVSTPDIVPAGTLDKEIAKKTLGDDALTYTDLNRVGVKPGGSVPGATYADATGQKWIVKYIKDEEIARNEVLTGKLYEALGVEVPELRLVRGPKGETWVASKWLDEFTTDAAGLQSTKRIPGLYDNFVADAWLSNWDVVGASYDNIGLAHGRALRIDVGGGLRFRAQGGLKTEAQFPNQVVDLDNMRNPSLSPLVSKVFKDITQSELNAGALKVINLPDDSIRNLVKQYGPKNPLENDKLANKMIARKADIKKRFPEADGPPKPVNPTPVPDDLAARVTAEEARMVADARLNGYDMKTDFNQIEGQNVLISLERTKDGQDVVQATFKVIGQGETNVRKAIGKAAQETASAGPKLAVETQGILDAKNDLDAKMLTFVKGFAKQVAEGGTVRAVDRERFLAMAEARVQLGNKISTLGPLANFSEKLEDLDQHYRNLMRAYDETLDSVGQPAKWYGGNKVLFEKFDLTPIIKEAPKPAETSGFKFTKKTGAWREKKTVRGLAQDTGQEVSGYGDKFVHVEPGIEIEVRSSTDYVAINNMVSIRVVGDPKEAMEKVFQKMTELGLNSARAGVLDRKHLYLTQMAYLKKSTWAEWNASGLRLKSKAEQVDGLAAMVKRDFKITDASIDAAIGDRRQAFNQGWEFNERADLTGPAWDAFAQEHRLIHRNTGGMDMTSLVDLIMETGGRMAPTVDKIRRGIKLGGMSPTSDLASGGADYFFTRLNTVDQARNLGSGTFVFKADAVRRTNTISYGSDLYGRTNTTEFIQSNRKVTLAELRTMPSKGSNETIIKGGVSLFDELDYVMVGSEADRQKMIAMLRDKHNMTSWPDGRRLDEVVHTSASVKSGAPLSAATKTGAVPPWAATAPEKYKSLKSQGYTDDHISNIWDKQGLTPKVAPVQSVAPSVPSPAAAFSTSTSGVPDWAHGYEEYYKKWSKEGFSPSELKKKVDTYAKYADVYPSWIKGAWNQKTAKDAYKAAKQSGTMDELTLHQHFYDQGLTQVVPPIKVIPMPAIAKGYEKYYDKWKAAGESDAVILKKLKQYEGYKDVYPSWLNQAYKDQYKNLKAIGDTDAQIFAEQKSLVK